MKRDYPNRNVDVCLIATSGINMGIRLLSSYLKEKGYTVVLGFFDKWDGYTNDELKSIAGWVEEINPRVLGFSMIEPRRDKLAAIVTALKAGTRTMVAGGTDPTFCPEEYTPHVDFVIRGESEEALAELVEALLSGGETKDIRNLCYTGEDGKIVINPLRPVIQDLDTLPFEDWLDVSHHFELKEGAVRQLKNCIAREDFFISSHAHGLYLYTMRGCSLSCSYCACSAIQNLIPGGRRVRRRSVPGIVDWVAEMKRAEPTIDIVYFYEEDFMLRSLEEIRDFASRWKEKVGLPFFIFCTPLYLEEKKFQLLIDAGLYVVNMGIQSGSERTNYDIYNRKISNEKTMSAMRLLTSHVGRGRFGFLPSTHDIITNNPYESREDLLDTIRLIVRMPKPYYLAVSPLQFFGGTVLYDKARRDGIVNARDEGAQYSALDVPRHFKLLVERGGDCYLNSLLFWMSGKNTRFYYGVVPAAFLPLLTWGAVARFFNKRPGLVSFLNEAITGFRKAGALSRMLPVCFSRIFTGPKRTAMTRS